MKIKAKQTVEVEMEIELPYFLKRTTGNYFGIISNDKALKITEDGKIESLYPESASQFIEDGDSIQVSAGEFTAVFDKAIEQLQALKSQFFKP